jgi:hypothetical protein
MRSGLFELDEETLAICFRSSKRLQNLRAHVEVYERIRDLISVSGVFDEFSKKATQLLSCLPHVPLNAPDSLLLRPRSRWTMRSRRRLPSYCPRKTIGAACQS